MLIDIQQTALMVYLKEKNPEYFGKALEVHQAVKGWLQYIPQTFPHYTSHTIEHSEEIIRQLSQLLFVDGSPEKPVLKELSAIEAYILIVAAYLHDAGMVAPDQEKLDILSSPEWNAWITESGGGAKRWNDIAAFRSGAHPPDEATRNFIADIQVRHLLAEFIRKSHHHRASSVITQHQGQMGRLAFDNPMLVRTIADVCVAHGLQQHELEDRERFPDRRDIRGEKVNVRLMAILLRLGDLLDMDCDRACPLLINAACPLPSDSLAHWTQYQMITHRLTAPDRIEIIAECENQKEHRFLQDWCQWLVDELKAAGLVMSRVKRHANWQPPIASMDGDLTIKIRPSATAKYIPANWIFELDRDAVFQRLIYDAYDNPDTFVRELIQNAADANRCQMYADLEREGVESPAYPTQVDEERRKRYPIKISLRTQEKLNPLSGEMEPKQVLVIDDSGIVMDRDIIQRYFLQVGRSYYTTEEFRRSFAFAPTSRFGIGFLSVFSVSDEVVVETYKTSSQAQSMPIKLELAGPRSYLLTERGERRVPGTRIEIYLKKPMEAGHLTEVVENWCRRLEFPVLLDDLGEQKTIEAEKPEDFVCEVPTVTDPAEKLVIRSFPVNREGIEGELYIFAHITEQGESWADLGWATGFYLTSHPQAIVPSMPKGLICFHGLTIDEDSHYLSVSYRLDYRGSSFRPNITRSSIDVDELLEEWRIDARWDEIVADHLNTTPLAKGEEAWKYKQELMGIIGSQEFWSEIPDIILFYREGHPYYSSISEFQAFSIINIIATAQSRSIYEKSIDFGPEAVSWEDNTPTLLSKDLSLTSRYSFILSNKALESVRFLPSGHVSYTWKNGERGLFYNYGPYNLTVVPLPNARPVSLLIPPDGYYLSALNSNHPFVQWLIAVKEACTQEQYGLTEDQFSNLMGLIFTPVFHSGLNLENVNRYLRAWMEMPGLPDDLKPPCELTEDMLEMKLNKPGRSRRQNRKRGKR